LYERGEVDEADRLLDETYHLGAEGGVVEIMIARYVTGARTGRGNYWPSPAARPHRQRADAAGPAGPRVAGTA
jgi:serine/threonine-protein kinase PknK